MGPTARAVGKVSAIVAAGGQGRRLGAGVPKQLVEIGGRSILAWSVSALLEHDLIDELVLVLPAALMADRPLLPAHASKPIRLVAGGSRRQDSVANGFAAVSSDTRIVVVHDAARPFVTPRLIRETIEAAAESGAAIAALPARDTIKLAGPSSGAGQAGQPPTIEMTVPRDRVWLAQTPQAFRRDVLADAIEAGRDGEEATDEAQLAERAGHRVRLVEGDVTNVKITTTDDLDRARHAHGRPMVFRVGTGYDLHRLAPGRPLVLGGVPIPFGRGLAGHSDADALAHAVTDAILGAACAGDIGRHFPDTDERWRGASSLDLLARAAGIVRAAGFAIVNVDAVVIAERPRLAPYIDQMCVSLARSLTVPPDCVSVKGKTSEGMGEVGRGEAIAAHAVALVARTDDTASSSAVTSARPDTRR